ncbi:hypothetical protein, partial [Opacimonas viscosa]
IFATTGSVIITPNQSALVQVEVNQNTWSGGNDTALNLVGTRSTASALRQRHGFVHRTAAAAQLVIAYHD